MENTETETNHNLEIPHNEFQEEHQKATLPTAYVMWLTIRSKFIDYLGETDTEILNKWKQFEDVELEKLQQLNPQN